MATAYALLLAGGGGTRLWPMSRLSKPKQMLPLVEERTMFRSTVERLDPLFTPDRIYVSTTQAYIEDLRAEAPEIPTENFIAEPSAKNNAAAIGLALTIIQKRDPDAVIAMMPTDHHISKMKTFRDILQAACTIAQDNYIVTLGIEPDFPATGYGYIQQGEVAGEVDGLTYYAAKRFTEKPDVVKATQFVASGEYSWNSGMFIWHVKQALREFETQQAEMYRLLHQLQPTVDTPEFDATLEQIWEHMPEISIDYGIMEHAERMTIIPVDIGWSDVGSWASLFDVTKTDKFGNCGKSGSTDSQRIILDTHDTLLYTDKLAVAIGVDNLIVVETDDTIMICKKDRAQDVREVVKYLRENNMTDYL